jgi:hypothetical protein
MSNGISFKSLKIKGRATVHSTQTIASSVATFVHLILSELAPKSMNFTEG